MCVVRRFVTCQSVLVFYSINLCVICACSLTALDLRDNAIAAGKIILNIVLSRTFYVVSYVESHVSYFAGACAISRLVRGSAELTILDLG